MRPTITSNKNSTWYYLARHTLPFLHPDLQHGVSDEPKIISSASQGVSDEPKIISSASQGLKSTFELMWRREFLLSFPPKGLDILGRTKYGKQFDKVNFQDEIFKADLIEGFFGVPQFFSGESYELWPTRAWKVIKNGIKVAWTTISHLPKLATEFLPAYLQLLLLKNISRSLKIIKELAVEPTNTWFGEQSKAKNYSKRSWYYFKIAVVTIVFVVLKCWNLLGTAITSPARSMRQAAQAGSKIAGAITDDPYWRPKLKLALGWAFATLSLAVTVAVYVVVFPLGIKATITHGPAFIGAAFHALNNSPLVQGIGHAVSQMVSPFASALKATLFAKLASMSGACSTLTAAATAALVPICAGWNQIKEGMNHCQLKVKEGAKFCKTKITEWWDESSAPAKAKYTKVSEENNDPSRADQSGESTLNRPSLLQTEPPAPTDARKPSEATNAQAATLKASATAANNSSSQMEAGTHQNAADVVVSRAVKRKPLQSVPRLQSDSLDPETPSPLRPHRVEDFMDSDEDREHVSQPQ